MNVHGVSENAEAPAQPELKPALALVSIHAKCAGQARHDCSLQWLGRIFHYFSYPAIPDNPCIEHEVDSGALGP